MWKTINLSGDSPSCGSCYPQYFGKTCRGSAFLKKRPVMKPRLRQMAPAGGWREAAGAWSACGGVIMGLGQREPCVDVSMSTWLSIYSECIIYIYIYTYCVCISMCMCVCVYVCVYHACMHACMHVDGWMDGCTYTHVRCTSKHVMIYLHVYFLINPNLIEDDWVWLNIMHSHGPLSDIPRQDLSSPSSLETPNKEV